MVVLLRRRNPGPVCYDSRATYLLFHQKKKTISLLLPPPLLQSSLLQTLMYLFYKNHQKNQNSKLVQRSDEISQESESRQSSSDSVAVLFQSFTARVCVGDASKAEGGLTYSTFTVLILRLHPVCSKESRP